MKTICICGSTRFINQMSWLAWDREKEGHIVFTPRLLPGNTPGLHGSYAPDSHAAEAANVKVLIDAAYKRKIEMSDEVLVYNEGGYIGESTRSEIAHAERLGKPVTYVFDKPATK